MSAPLSINPQATELKSIAASVAGVTNSAAARLASDKSIASTLNVDAFINQASGGIGSGLNGATAGIAQATTALGGIGSQVQNAVAAGASTLQSAVGSISNITADIAGTLNKLGGAGLASGVQQFAGAISKAAGAANNVLSLFRGANIPAGAESSLLSRSGTPISVVPQNKSDWRVKIDCNWSTFGDNPLFSELKTTGGVVWPYMPSITVATKANYTQIDPVHSNYPYYSYKNSQIDEIQITGDFSCETEKDAAYWIAATTFFKTATKMFFGTGNNVGNPPIICKLTGYGASIFKDVPVIVKSFSVELKDDVNYVYCNTFGTSTWVPVLSTITVTVSPIYNRVNQRKFSLEQYAKGTMVSGSGMGYL